MTLTEEPAAATIPGGLNFVFSTTHPLNQEQTNVSYHISLARHKPRL